MTGMEDDGLNEELQTETLWDLVPSGFDHRYLLRIAFTPELSLSPLTLYARLDNLGFVAHSQLFPPMGGMGADLEQVPLKLNVYYATDFSEAETVARILQIPEAFIEAWHDDEEEERRTSSEKLVEMVEKAAEEIVMLDLKDLPSLAKYSKSLDSIANTSSKYPFEIPNCLAGDVQRLCAEASSKASALVQNIILEESSHAEKDIEITARTISALQSIICHGREAAFPEELGLNSVLATDTSENTDATASEAVLKNDVSGTSILDKELLDAFWEQQVSVLPDIEKEILEFEEDKDLEHIAALKRIIHTIKGEAGCCQFNEVEMVCHKLEDYLDCRTLAEERGMTEQDVAEMISSDVLLEVKDWLTHSSDLYAEHKKPKGVQDLLAKMSLGSVVSARVDGQTVVEESDELPKVDIPKPDVASIVSIAIFDSDLVGEFVSESQEHFDIADENLLILENEPEDTDAVNAVFRSFHTIKGVCAFLGLAPISKLSHKAETLLDNVRKKKLSFQGGVVDVTFKALDMLKQMMGDLGDALASGSDFTTRAELSGVMKELDFVLSGEDAVVVQGLEAQPDTSKPLDIKQPSQTDHVDHEDDDNEAMVDVAHSVPKIPGTNQPKGSAPKVVMKVDAEKIDMLLDAIGELVIAETMVAGDPVVKGSKSMSIKKNMSQLGKITRQLQNMAMAMRLVPVAGLFKKMARLVRDLSKKCGKRIEFSVEGQETEVDKSMIDKLGDPLVHMIRNCVDHGIESSEQTRIDAGKDPVGHVTLKAFHKGGSVYIQIIDDGRGLNRDGIVTKAVERGLIRSDKGMSDQEVYALIFEAGFSTAEKVTEVSGRGVGMDVVRRNIEALRGKVLIESTPGRGSVFTIALPLTTAIIDGMITRSGKEVYIVPTLSIVQSIKPTADMISSLEGKGEVFEFRDHLVPLFHISKLFNTTGDIGAIKPTDGIVIVVEDSGKQMALVFDELLGQQQTVIKNLGEGLGAIKGVSGASIMANGKPGLILDVGGIAEIAGQG